AKFTIALSRPSFVTLCRPISERLTGFLPWWAKAAVRLLQGGANQTSPFATPNARHWPSRLMHKAMGPGMKQSVPWSVKGVEADARETAKELARRSGMTLGQWLNAMIAEQTAEGEPGEQASATAANVSPLDDLADRLGAMNRRASSTAAPEPTHEEYRNGGR